ncbi:MAG: SDR family oxidoreductase [Candidatus Methylomirabilales bacterium]
MILMVGATGRVGSEVVRQLRQQGRPVRALCRSETRAKPLQDADVEIALGDLANRGVVEKACQGVSTIISTMTSLNPRSRGAQYRPEVIEGEGHRNLVEAGGQAGVTQVIYLSAIGVEHPDAPRQFRVKRQVEEIVKSGGLPYTILRPSGFMENLLPMIPAIQRFPITPLPGRGTAPITYIAVKDIARVAVQAVGHPEAQGATIEYGGPEDLSNRQCVQILAKVLGRSARICPIPLALFHLVGTVAQPVSPGLREFFAILRYVDRYGLRAPRRPPLSNEGWNPISFEEFVRGHIGVPEGSH